MTQQHSSRDTLCGMSGTLWGVPAPLYRTVRDDPDSLERQQTPQYSLQILHIQWTHGTAMHKSSFEESFLVWTRAYLPTP